MYIFVIYMCTCNSPALALSYASRRSLLFALCAISRLQFIVRAVLSAGHAATHWYILSHTATHCNGHAPETRVCHLLRISKSITYSDIYKSWHSIFPCRVYLRIWANNVQQNRLIANLDIFCRGIIDLGLSMWMMRFRCFRYCWTDPYRSSTVSTLR